MTQQQNAEDDRLTGDLDSDDLMLTADLSGDDGSKDDLSRADLRMKETEQSAEKTKKDLEASSELGAAMGAANAPALAHDQQNGQHNALENAQESGHLPDLLRNSGLRPTRQRLALAALLFAGNDRHVTAELLHEEAVESGERVSLATVYNTLHQFRGVGLLREIAIDGAKTYFDTNTSDHSHFFIEDEGVLVDIAGDAINVAGVPAPPLGTEIAHIDVIIRLRKND